MLVTNIPCNGKFIVTYPFGVYDEKLNYYNADKRHHGTDIVIENKIVYSASMGTVIFAGWNSQGYGNLVIVKNGNYTFYYAHLSKIYVKYNDSVDFLTQIGVQGATGNVTGEHLHFEVRYNNIVQNSSDYMKIPNRCGIYNSYDYAYETETSNTTQESYNYKIGTLVVYDNYHENENTDTMISCMEKFGSWQQDFISDIIVGAKNPYRLKNGRFLNNSNIKEVK